MEKMNQRVMLTKRLLKESFTELLKEKDIHKISIRKLCSNAGINHCTFYKYYGSQYDLLKEMESDMLQKVEEELTKSNSEEPIKMLLGYLENNLDIARMLINNNIDPQFPEKLFSSPLIQQRFTDELGKNYSSDDCEYLSNFIFYGAFRMIQIWLNKDRRESPEEMARIMYITFNQIIEHTKNRA